MDILADENVPGAAVERLRDAGHDVSWVSEDAPGTADPEVLERASKEDRLLVTFDKDFGDLAYRSGLKAPAGIVLFRLPSMPPKELSRFMTDSLETQVDWKGHFSVVSQLGIRMRVLPRR